MVRPSVDVVVPFKGTPAELEELCARLSRLRLRAGDEFGRSLPNERRRRA